MATNDYYIIDNFSADWADIVLENYPKIQRFIWNYINRESETLNSRNPGKRLMFAKCDESAYYECTGLDKTAIQNILKSSPNANTSFIKQMDPLLNSLACMFIVYQRESGYFKDMFNKNAKNYKAPHEIINLMLTMKVYSGAQYTWFRYEPPEGLMDYVVDNLNGRYDLAHQPSIFALISYWAETNSKSMDKVDFTRMTDKELFYYVSKLYDRIKSFFKNIYDLMERSKKEGKYIKTQNMDMDNGEGKTMLTELSSVSNDVELTSSKILTHFIQEKVVNKTLLRAACKKTKTNETKMEMLIIAMRDSNDTELLLKIIKMVISYWIVSMREKVSTIHSKRFIVSCASAYAISNTNDPYIFELKKALDQILKKYSEDYAKIERQATLSNFRQTIFLYLIFYISNVA